MEKSAETIILGVLRFDNVHMCDLKYISKNISKIGFFPIYESSQPSLHDGQRFIYDIE